jgi:Lipid A 3-O-deacylase (PagL)
MIMLRGMLKRGFLAALLSLAWVGGAWSPCMAGEFGVEWVAIRGGMSGGSPIGEEQNFYFRQLDLAAKFRLPWEKEIGSDWVFGSKMLGSAGVLNGGNESNAVVAFLPLAFSLARKDNLLSLDVGGGWALLSDYKFGTQNFGGPFQFVWTFGVTSRLVGPFGLGYQFWHYSDATLYGSDSRGADLHLFELIYWFGDKR